MSVHDAMLDHHGPADAFAALGLRDLPADHGDELFDGPATHGRFFLSGDALIVFPQRVQRARQFGEGFVHGFGAVGGREFPQCRGVPVQRVQERDAGGEGAIRDQRREERVVHPAAVFGPLAQFAIDHGVIGRREGVSGYRGHHARWSWRRCRPAGPWGWIGSPPPRL